MEDLGAALYFVAYYPCHDIRGRGGEQNAYYPYHDMRVGQKLLIIHNEGCNVLVISV